MRELEAINTADRCDEVKLLLLRIFFAFLFLFGFVKPPESPRRKRHRISLMVISGTKLFICISSGEVIPV